MSTPGSYRPTPPPRPGPVPPRREDGESTGHPAVDAAIRGMVNAAHLSAGDQIAQYEAAYEILRETLASIDQS